LHQQNEVASISGSANVSWDNKPGSVDHFNGSARVEVSEIDSDVPKAVVAVVVGTNSYPAVVSQGLIHSNDGIVDVVAGCTTQLVLIELPVEVTFSMCWPSAKMAWRLCWFEGSSA